MKKIFFIAIVLHSFMLYAQEKGNAPQKKMELYEQQQIINGLKKSDFTNDEYQQSIYKNSSSTDLKFNLNELKVKTILENSSQQEELLLEDSFQQEELLQNYQQNKFFQPETIGDEKENQDKLPDTPVNKPEDNKSPDNSKKIYNDDLENDNNRLFGPSQFDSRIEPTQLNSSIYWQQQILLKSNSVGMILERNKITQLGKDFYQIDDQQTLGKRYNLCPNEAFFSQPIVGVGTGWLYDTNKMITASHVFEGNIQNYIVIFGFQILNKYGLTDVFIDKSRIYEIKKIIKQDSDLDLVSFELDRSALGTPLEWEKPPQNTGSETEIYMMGYPTGLPLKIAMNASIIENKHPNYYYTSLDSFQGNSGSPVFNFYTNKVIGVLVSGEIDYKFNGNCYYSPVCKVPYCKGEKVICIESFMEN